MRGIARMQIGRARIAAAPIATAVYRDVLGFLYQYTPGIYTFTPPQAGLWKFVLWGAGGGCFNGTSGQAAGSGAYCETNRRLDPAQNVTIIVGAGSTNSGGATTVTFPDGTVVSAGGGVTGNSTGVGGVASGGDVNLAGSAAGQAGGGTGGGTSAGTTSGGGAPANLPYRGGSGGAANASGQSPGGGAGAAGPGLQPSGGSGLAMAFLLTD